MLYAKKDPRIQYYRNEKNLGSVPNFNRVFELSQAPYFKWMCHDDLIDENFLETCLQVMKGDPEITVCQTREKFINKDTKFYHFDKATTIFTDPDTGFQTLGDPAHIAEQDKPHCVLLTSCITASGISISRNDKP